MRILNKLTEIKRTTEKLKIIQPSIQADLLLFFTANHESGFFNHTRQNVNNFDARTHAISYYQIEFNTFMDLYNNWLRFRPEHLVNILYFTDKNEYDFNLFIEMEHNFKLATAIARYIYFRQPEALPDFNNSFLINAAKYWKKYYNTHLGKGIEEKFINDANHTFKNIYNKL